MPTTAPTSTTAPVAILSIRGAGKSYNGYNHTKRQDR
jgi:hypothetical protein